MKGFQITFFTEQNRKHRQKPLAEWLMEFARDNGVSGATMTPGSESYGATGPIHSAHFFELADQPVAVTMAVDEETSYRLFNGLKKENVAIFYVKSEVEFGPTIDNTTAQAGQTHLAEK